VELLLALLSSGDAADNREKRPAAGASLPKVFALPPCRAFMQVHTSNGVEWFNKERFEELVAWLCAIGLADLVARQPAPRALTAWMSGAEETLQRHADLAAHAGYRTALFLRLLEPEGKGAAPGAAKAVAPKTGSTGKPVKEGARTRPIKTK
jgi:hypothetical protein